MVNLSSISKLSKSQTRSISPENVYGEKGRGGMTKPGELAEDVARIGQVAHFEKMGFSSTFTRGGQGWKVRPCIKLPANTATTVMDVGGPGIIQHMWFTFKPINYRDIIMRIYWDHEKEPSVEVPLGEFFCCGFMQRAKVLALPINVNPSGGMNCYFPMPFRKHVRITLENRFVEDVDAFFYTINYALSEIDKDEAYFHAQFRRSNPVQPMEDHIILDGVKGTGHYVGCYMAWKQRRPAWWGEGEFKVWLDGDQEFPTICGTGTEDYFGGAWCFGETFSAPFLGYPYSDGTRHGLYRFHIMDPIRFDQDIKIAIQALGWKNRYSYAHLEDDIASVAYWYQNEPHQTFPSIEDPFIVNDRDAYA